MRDGGLLLLLGGKRSLTAVERVFGGFDEFGQVPGHVSAVREMIRFCRRDDCITLSV